MQVSPGSYRSLASALASALAAVLVSAVSAGCGPAANSSAPPRGPQGDAAATEGTAPDDIAPMPLTPTSAGPAPARPAAAGGLSPAAQVLLDAHNGYRAKHCAAPLTWSPKLAAFAQEWANTLKAKGCMFGHSSGGFGENLAAGTTGALPPEAAVTMWYDEVGLYSFKKPVFSMETGHFTQVVWRGTTQLGCAMSQCKGMDIWVCEYDPPGNWQGKFAEQVLPVGCK